jgi:TonB-dependent receptor
MHYDRFRSALVLASAVGLALACPTFAAAADQGQQTAEDRAKEAREVIVTAPRLETTARLQQFAAPNIVNVQSAETIAKYPDFNASEALGRIAGVSLSIDTGEGRYVNIRGIDGNLNGATYGGVPLLNTQATLTYFNFTGRAVEMDTVPIGAVDRIEVVKTGLPDREAEGLGGTVNLIPRSALAVTHPFFEGTLGGGYEPLHQHPLFRDEVVVGDAIGPVSFVLTQTQMNDQRAIDDVEEGYVDGQPVVPDKAYSTLELRRYNYHRRRFGYSGEVDYKPDDNNRWYLRASIAGYTEAVRRQRLLYDQLGGNLIVDPANPNGFIALPIPGDVPDSPITTVTLRDEQETHRNTIFVVGGVNNIGPAVLDYHAGYVRATFHKPYDINSTFNGPSNLTIAYDNTTDPNFPTVKVLTPGVDVTNPALYSLTKISSSNEYDTDREWSGAANLSFPVHLLSAEDHIQVGGEVRLRNKINIPTNVHYSGYPAFTPFTQLLGQGPYVYYDNHYAIGYSPSPLKIRQFIMTNLLATSALNNGGYFNDDENVYAGYAEYTGTWGKWGVLAGVRVEHTDTTLRGISSVTDPLGDTIPVPVSTPNSYTNPFPTVQVRYQATQAFVARATFSTGIARPGFLQTIQSSFVDEGAGTVTTGNPKLKPTYGYNYDLSLEYYLPNAGIVSLGAFDKEFNDYIVARGVIGPYPGIVGLAHITTFENVQNAYARGVEANYSQRFTFLPAPFDGLGLDANATYVSSQVELRTGETVAQPGTSMWTGNGALSYEKGPVQVRLATEYVGKTLFTIGGSRATDVFQDARLTLDLTSSYQVNHNFEVYFEARNLLNTPLRFYEGTENRPIQREFYDITLEAGIKIRFGE